MDPKLKEFEDANQSFCQYVMNFDFANIDEETRRLHSIELLDIALERQSILMQRAEAREEGREEGRKEGREEGRKETAAIIAEKDAALAETNAALAEKDAEIAALKAQLGI